MDTSRKYVKMCLKAEEIQDMYVDVYPYNGEDGNVFALRKDHDSSGVFGHCYRKDELIWLPKQDQLQEMAFPDKSTSVRQICEAIFGFVISSYVLAMCSMEQLWLAFVMKENYSKIWNGEEWAVVAT